MLTIPREGSCKSASPEEERQAPGSADLLLEGWESAGLSELRGEEQRGDVLLPL